MGDKCCSCPDLDTVTGQDVEVFGVSSLHPFKVERMKGEWWSLINP